MSPHPRTAALSCAIALLTVASAPAVAQSEQAARVHYESGQRLFDAGAYGLAIGEFRAALELSGRTALWFNIGQAHRLRGDCTAALAAYRRYAELDPEARARTNVDQRIEEMTSCLAERAEAWNRDHAARLARLSATPPPAPEVARPAAMDAPVIDDGTRMRWLGGAVVASALVSVGASIYLRERASGDADDLTRRFAHGGAWDGASADLERRIATDRRRAVMLASAGGVALVAGCYLYLYGHKQGEYARQFAVAPRAGGAEMVWSWSF
jgi:tetratricopeptide (TPR) repeat protein